MTDSSNKEWKENLKESRSWLRGLYMLVVLALGFIACLLVLAVTAFQFILALLTRQPNAQLISFGSSLAEYIHQTINYLIYNTEDRPFPFAEWPKAVVTAGAKTKEAKPKAAE